MYACVERHLDLYLSIITRSSTWQSLITGVTMSQGQTMSCQGHERSEPVSDERRSIPWCRDLSLFIWTTKPTWLLWKKLQLDRYIPHVYLFLFTVTMYLFDTLQVLIKRKEKTSLQQFYFCIFSTLFGGLQKLDFAKFHKIHPVCNNKNGNYKIRKLCPSLQWIIS